MPALPGAAARSVAAVPGERIPLHPRAPNVPSPAARGVPRCGLRARRPCGARGQGRGRDSAAAQPGRSGPGLSAQGLPWHLQCCYTELVLRDRVDTDSEIHVTTAFPDPCKNSGLSLRLSLYRGFGFLRLRQVTGWNLVSTQLL